MSGGIVGAVDVVDWVAELRRQHSGVTLEIEERPGGWLYLGSIVVPAADRGQGRGSAVMRDIVAFADEHQLQVAVVPAGDYGGSERRLRRFYARFGFVRPPRAIPEAVAWPAMGTPNRVLVRDPGPHREL